MGGTVGDCSQTSALTSGRNEGDSDSVSNDQTFRQWLEQRLNGHSWDWLGKQLDPTMSGTGIRHWADHRRTLPGWRADQIAAVFHVDTNVVRTLAGIELRESDGLVPADLVEDGSDEDVRVGLLSAYYAMHIRSTVPPEQMSTELLADLVSDWAKRMTNPDPHRHPAPSDVDDTLNKPQD